MFLRKIFDHLLNQVLVESLANARWFQKFAVWSSITAKELGEKSKQHTSGLDERFSKFAEVAKQQSEKLRREFEQEMERSKGGGPQDKLRK